MTSIIIVYCPHVQSSPLRSFHCFIVTIKKPGSTLINITVVTDYVYYSAP